jgi:hypothetical protein
MPTLTSRKRISRRQVTRDTAASKSHKGKKEKKRKKRIMESTFEEKIMTPNLGSRLGDT